MPDSFSREGIREPLCFQPSNNSRIDPMQNLRNKIIFSLLFALFVFLALSFYADLPRLIGAFEKFQWSFLPFALGATLVNYLLRFIRWHYYLSVIGVNNVPRRDSLSIFLSGFALTMTPGKLGEFQPIDVFPR